jgi:hypothetical protein
MRGGVCDQAPRAQPAQLPGSAPGSVPFPPAPLEEGAGPVLPPVEDRAFFILADDGPGPATAIGRNWTFLAGVCGRVREAEVAPELRPVPSGVGNSGYRKPVGGG